MNVEEISPKSAIEAVEHGAIFVDVREPYELDEVQYGIKFIHIPMGEIQERMNELSKDSEIIVGCRSGKRSMNVCLFLKMNGFEHVRNLEGGILGWIENACPTK